MKTLSVYNHRVPFFSVICCTYNRCALLPRALASLQAQTEKDWELIVVDDGSTDGTLALLQEHARLNPRIRILHHANRGVGASRNAGILAACGVFVTFLDSDDEYAPEHLALRKEACREYPEIPFFHGGVAVIGNAFVPDKNDPTRSIAISDCVVGGTFVIRRDLLVERGGFPHLRYADDAVFFEEALSEGVPIARLEHPTYRYYRDTPDSLCSTFAVDQ
ncbi:MAG: glycosyltransferase family 2 protein [Candidatus Kapaibacterium sp.]|jgi:glycosyltransferase involved in cell wall biosynthesis